MVNGGGEIEAVFTFCEVVEVKPEPKRAPPWPRLSLATRTPPHWVAAGLGALYSYNLSILSNSFCYCYFAEKITGNECVIYMYVVFCTVVTTS